MAAHERTTRRLLALPAAAGPLLLALAACGSSNQSSGPGADSGLDGASSGGDSGADGTAPRGDSGVDAAATDAAPPADSGFDATTGIDSSTDVGAPSTDASSMLDAAGDVSMLDAAGDGSPDGGPVCAPPTGTVFAMSQLTLGDGNAGQWKAYGFNIDGQDWMAGATNHCQPNSGANPANVFPNGNNGIDNSFGHNVLPLIISVDPTWPTDIDNGITNGNFSMLLKMYCLPPSGDAPSLLTKLFDATALGSTPKWDGTDAWPVAPELLSNPTDPESSTIAFDMSSVTGSLFDSGKNQTITLALPFAINGTTTWLTLAMQAAEITLNLSASRTSATGGMLGGVLDTADFVNQVEMIGYALGLCGTQAMTNLVTAIEQASDIMSDGTQDPTQTCNGISIGLGLDMVGAQLGGVGPAKPTQMACP